MKFSFDYEIYGNGDGDISSCLVNPTNQLLKVASGFEKLIFYVDVTMLQTFFNTNKSKFDQIYRNLSNVSDLGHELRIHIHPQWYEYQLKNEEIFLGEIESHKRMRELYGNEYLDYIDLSINNFFSLFPNCKKILRFGGLSCDVDNIDISFFKSIGITGQSNLSEDDAFFGSQDCSLKSNSLLYNSFEYFPIYSINRTKLKYSRIFNKAIKASKNNRTRKVKNNNNYDKEIKVPKVIIPDFVQLSFWNLLSDSKKQVEVLGHTKNLGSLINLHTYISYKKWMI